MYYILYLSSLCRRRRWPDPLYEPFVYGGGYACNVRVNHRDYQVETVHETEELAREAAAMRAYLICRNLSANDSLTGGTASTGQSQSNGNGLPMSPHTGYGSSSGAPGGSSYGSSDFLPQPHAPFENSGGWNANTRV